MLPIKINLTKCADCISKEEESTVPVCISDCPADCIALDKSKKPYVSYPDECKFCGNCRISCPYNAIEIVFPISMII